VRVEVFTNGPLLYSICPTCNNLLHMTKIDLQSNQIDEYPRYIREENERIAELLNKLVVEFGDRILIRLDTVFDLRGFLRTIRRKVWRTPAFVVNGRKMTGIPDEKVLFAAVKEAIAEEDHN
jgi:hypothetical protein